MKRNRKVYIIDANFLESQKIVGKFLKLNVIASQSQQSMDR
jgi:hypothetical protein